MIRRILTVVIVLLAIIFAVAWLIGGGFQAIQVATKHFSLPSGNLVEFISGTGPDSLGEQFTLPGTPSSFPTPQLPSESTTTHATSQASSAQAQQRASQEQQLQELQAQYSETEQQLQELNQGQSQPTPPPPTPAQGY